MTAQRDADPLSSAPVLYEQERPSAVSDAPRLSPCTLRRLLLDWHDEAQLNAAMHDMSWAHFRRWNMLTMVGAMTLASVSGLSTITLGQGAASGACGPPPALLMGLGLCGVVGSLLMGINRFAGYAELQQQHDFFSDSYEILHRDIAFNIVVNNTGDSVFASEAEYMKHCKIQMDTLLERAPAVPFAVRSAASSARVRPKADPHLLTRRGNINRGGRPRASPAQPPPPTPPVVVSVE